MSGSVGTTQAGNKALEARELVDSFNQNKSQNYLDKSHRIYKKILKKIMKEASKGNSKIKFYVPHAYLKFIEDKLSSEGFDVKSYPRHSFIWNLDYLVTIKW